jgi:hypothetical protein
MTRMITEFFEDYQEANDVVRALEASGVLPAHINLITSARNDLKSLASCVTRRDTSGSENAGERIGGLLTIRASASRVSEIEMILGMFHGVRNPEPVAGATLHDPRIDQLRPPLPIDRERRVAR